MFKQIRYWVVNYGSAGLPDQRALSDFLECETNEVIHSFRNELVGLAQSKKSDDAALDALIGQKRKVLYNSYEEWAKVMLLWLAGMHRGS